MTHTPPPGPPADQPLFTHALEVAYHADAAARFAALTTNNANTTANDVLLLESADIESKKSLNCIAITQAALKVTCSGHAVTLTPLTDAGQAMAARTHRQLADYATGPHTFVFPPATAVEERARLQAISTAAVLRSLQLNAGYAGQTLPFLGGGFAFDYVASFEDLPPVGEGPNTFPDYEFLVAQTLLRIDHESRTAHLEGVGLDAAEVQDRLRELASTLETVTAPETVAQEASASPASEARTVHARATMDDATFRAHVADLQGHIQAGDIYQVVPARAFEMECPDAFAAYRQLRASNPSPYMFYMKASDYELFGASPESNLKFAADTRQIEVYPIAGTRPRGLNPDGSINHELDIRNELQMRTDLKEVAEHTMLVDLARNDVARVAVPATRRVADLLQVDRYSRVMHLVSRVTATLHEDFDALDAYRACMNMGTLTGAPKLKAMELLGGVEGIRRGSYGGAIGYVRGDGSLDTCIVIRSAFVRDGHAVVQAGAGVVRDSQPQAEADETVHKAYAVLHAVARSLNADVEVIR